MGGGSSLICVVASSSNKRLCPKRSATNITFQQWFVCAHQKKKKNSPYPQCRNPTLQYRKFSLLIHPGLRPGQRFSLVVRSLAERTEPGCIRTLLSHSLSALFNSEAKTGRKTVCTSAACQAAGPRSAYLFASNASRAHGQREIEAAPDTFSAISS